ncbi:huntingtin-associated protein 1 [Prionailurus viverrinus]|uniref:huntingtin-associated protein 1 n=1 Tax=Prionailurus viverrinus TaxID=61388 RepID=UPI001FF67F41|nr:huntingtin-associated protein 1 [Prionailurus viverrinus]
MVLGGTPRASAFAAAQRNAQFGPGNSDAQWTRFIFRGPFGPRATGLGTEKAAGIWKTPAAYIGRRPGVSGPEHAFIRELEEGAGWVTASVSRPMRLQSAESALRILHLRYQVSLRDDLLQLYSDSEEEEEEEDEEEPEEEEQPHYHSYGAPEPTCLRQTEVLHDWPQLEALQEQLRLLEEENEQLREEHGAETEKLQQQLASERVIQMRLQHELQDLQEKYTERGGMLTQAQEEVKTLCQQAPGSTDPVPRYTHAVPLEALPSFQEALGEELRRSIRIISDPVFFMERNHGKTEKEEMSHLGYRLCRSEVREQDRGLEAEKGLLTAEDFVVEDFVLVEELVPEEEPGATAEVASAEEGATEEAELVSEEAEAWEEVEPELDEATQGNVVTSALEASGLGPSRLNMKRVLQQLANWLDARYSRQLRLKMLQKGECSHRGLPPASQTSYRSSMKGEGR